MYGHRLLLTVGLAIFAAACGEPGGTRTPGTSPEAKSTAGGEGTAARRAVHTTTRVTVRPSQRQDTRRRPSRASQSPDAGTKSDVVVVQDPAPQRVVVVEAPPAYSPDAELQTPTPVTPSQNGEASAQGSAPVHCSGDDEVNIVDERVHREGGPAVIATGSCHLKIDESYVTGSPAIVVRDDAKVSLADSKIRGDLVSKGRGHVSMRRCDHRGRVVRRRVAGRQPVQPHRRSPGR